MGKIRAQLINLDPLRGLDVLDKKLIVKLGKGLEFDPHGAITLSDTIITSSGEQAITDKKIFYIAPVLEGSVTSDKSIVNKQFVDNCIDKYFWAQPLFTLRQCIDGHEGGILPACSISILDSNKICEYDISFIRIEYVLNNQTFYFDIALTKTPTQPNDVDISDIPLEDELAKRIVNTIKQFGTVNEAASNCTEHTFSIDNRIFILFNTVVELESFRVIISPTVDEYYIVEQAQHHNLGRQQIHLTKFVSYPLQLECKAAIWNTYQEKWRTYSMDNTATEDEAGVVKVGDGLTVDEDDRLRVDVGDSLQLVGTSPNKKVEISPHVAGDGLRFNSDNSLSLDINEAAGLKIEDGKLKIDILGDLFFTTSGQLAYFDITKTVTAEVHTLTEDNLNDGFFEISREPCDPRSVIVMAYGGLIHLNKHVNTSALLSDYDVCTEPGYRNRIYIKNDKIVGSYTSSRLTETYQVGDVLIVYYQYEE